MKVAIYTRFSSNNQTEMSTAAQVRACREFAEHSGMEIYKIYSDEAVSGTEEKTDARQQYQKLLADAKRHLFDMILIHKYDRIARSLEEHVRLSALTKKEKIPIIAVAQNFGDSIEGDFAKQMMWVLSEYYSKNLSKETKKGHKEAALKGLHNGGVPPFGYDVVDRHYVINETEAYYVRKMFESALKRESRTKLIEELRRAGIKGKRGKPLGYPSIYEILRNEKYTGTYLYTVDEEEDRMDRRSKPNAIRIDNAFPAIISKKTFKEVQEIMDGRKQMGKHSDYLCRGIVYCTCGAKMHATVWKVKNGKKHVYRCKADCGMKPIPMELVDKAATDYLEEFLSPEMQLKIAAFLRNYKNHQADARSGFEAARKKQIAEKQAMYDNLMKNMMSGVLAPEVVKDINDRMTAIKGEIETLKNAEPPKDYTMETILEWLDSIKKAPDQRAVELLIKKITVSRENNKTDFKIESNLKSVCVEMVAGAGLEPAASGL